MGMVGFEKSSDNSYSPGLINYNEHSVRQMAEKVESQRSINVKARFK